MTIINSVPGALMPEGFQAVDEDNFEILGRGSRRRKPALDPDYGECPDDEDYEFDRFEADDEYRDDADVASEIGNEEDAS